MTYFILLQVPTFRTTLCLAISQTILCCCCLFLHQSATAPCLASQFFGRFCALHMHYRRECHPLHLCCVMCAILIQCENIKCSRYRFEAGTVWDINFVSGAVSILADSVICSDIWSTNTHCPRWNCIVLRKALSEMRFSGSEPSQSFGPFLARDVRLAEKPVAGSVHLSCPLVLRWPLLRWLGLADYDKIPNIKCLGTLSDLLLAHCRHRRPVVLLCHRWSDAQWCRARAAPP